MNFLLVFFSLWACCWCLINVWHVVSVMRADKDRKCIIKERMEWSKHWYSNRDVCSTCQEQGWMPHTRRGCNRSKGCALTVMELDSSAVSGCCNHRPNGLLGALQQPQPLFLFFSFYTLYCLFDVFSVWLPVHVFLLPGRDWLVLYLSPLLFLLWIYSVTVTRVFLLFFSFPPLICSLSLFFFVLSSSFLLFCKLIHRQVMSTIQILYYTLWRLDLTTLHSVTGCVKKSH